ncbi:MAG: DUF4886 domain-containing protein [Clostridia bacterium]|nr:DUF4886 domain-containing protein [Clostridia bacterium]
MKRLLFGTAVLLALLAGVLTLVSCETTVPQQPGGDPESSSASAIQEPTAQSAVSHNETSLSCAHRFEVTVHEPGCATKGYTTYLCTLCGYIFNDDFKDPSGHSYVAVTVPASCTEEGYTLHTCEKCGDSYRDNVTEATGHRYLESVTPPNCDHQGYTDFLCSVCGYARRDLYTEPTGHVYTETKTVKPTCVIPGYTVYTCTQCGAVRKEETSAAGAHTYGEWTVSKPSTCSEKGEKIRICTVCKYIDRAETDYAAHKRVRDPAVQPTSTQTGLTAGIHCSVCGAITKAQTVVPARGTKWMLEDKCFKLLLIGNSFSQDAANCGEGMKQSQLLSILQAMLGKDVRITIGVCHHGNRSMAWHATQVYRNTSDYTFDIISTDDPTWRSLGTTNTKKALSYTNWDVVTLQPFGDESTTGTGKPRYPDEEDPRFYPLKESCAYMLDWVDYYAPQAEVYCYMHWSTTADNVMNAGLDAYKKKASFFPTVLTYRGTSTGQRFTDMIPVALAVQNARTTYFATLKYSNGTVTEILTTDAQSGLLRDGWHLTYNIGRYIAALTFAETLVPQSLRVSGYTLPGIRRSEAIGTLPEEYTVIAQKCVEATMKAFRRSDNRLEVLSVSGYATDPVVRAGQALKDVALTVRCKKSESALKEAVRDRLISFLPKDFKVGAVTLPSGILSSGSASAEVKATVTFGYSSGTVPVRIIIEYTS